VRKILGAVTEVVVGVAFGVAYVHLSRFLHSLGPREEASLLWIKVLPPVILAFVGWWL
jgi:lipopolysaccharide export LptBFGC system permease protein LptF